MRSIFWQCSLTLTLLFTCLGSMAAQEVAVTEPVKKVRFATDANYYPFEYFNENKIISGFDIEVAKAICLAEELECSFQQHRFDGLLLTLSFGQYDAVIAAIDITSERLKSVDFTDSYYREPPAFISRKTSQKEFSLKGKFVGVLANSSNQTYLNQFAPEGSYIVPYSSSEAALLDLQEQKIDAVFADFAVINSFLTNYQGQTKLAIQHTEEVFMTQFSEGYGIAVKKGNQALLERLNKGLKTIKANGIYDKIFDKYFPFKGNNN